MCPDAIVGRKRAKRDSNLALGKIQKVVIKMPSYLVHEVRAHAALQGERGPGPVIHRALIDYLKRNPMPASSL